MLGILDWADKHYDLHNISPIWCKTLSIIYILFIVILCAGAFACLFIEFPFLIKLYIALSYLWVGGAGYRDLIDFGYFLLAPIWIFLFIVVCMAFAIPAIL